MISAERMAVLLNGGGRGCQVDQGYEFGRELDSTLRNLGWKDAKTNTYCHKALFESYLEKDGANIRIISAWFLGHFTQIEVNGEIKPIAENSSLRFILED